MVYKIVFEPDSILHKRSQDITLKEIASKETQKFVRDMEETMYAKDGVGLAAVQVGIAKQLCVIAKEYNELNKKKCLTLINPTWVKLSAKTAWDEEGCLSVPGIFGKVKRYIKIKVKALDEHGKPLEFIAENFFARIVQHEADHLNGTLFIEKAKGLHKIEVTRI